MTNSYVNATMLDSHVGLVLTEWGDEQNAMTISCFAEAAHYPRTIWISVAPESYTRELIDAGGRFTLAVLHCGQRDIAWQCGTRSGRQTNKLVHLRTHRGPGGCLYLDDSLSAVACCVQRSNRIGDHIMYVAEIVAGEIETRNSSKQPLLIKDLL